MEKCRLHNSVIVCVYVSERFYASPCLETLYRVFHNTWRVTSESLFFVGRTNVRMKEKKFVCDAIFYEIAMKLYVVHQKINFLLFFIYIE